MADKRIALAAIPSGGCTKGGDAVTFDLKAKDGRMFEFSCPHEAVGEIVESLLLFADLARRERGQDEPFKPYGEFTERATKVSSFKTGISKDGAAMVLSLQCGPTITRAMSLTPEDAKLLGETLVETHRQWQNLLHERRDSRPN
jgi:hypothetical protein